MDLRIERADDGTWTLYRAGVVVASELTHAAAIDMVTAELNTAATEAARLAVNQEDALLPEEFTAPILCESGATGPTRDFSECVWTSRDPATNLVPLMLATTTEMGAHIGARLVGFFTSVDTSSATPSGAGRFFATEDGMEARDLLLGVDRFGVSVDPTENVTYRFECVEMSDDGWCEQERIVFETYEIGGATMTPFPGFERAYVTINGAAAAPAPPAEEEPAPEDTGDGGDGSTAGVIRTPISFAAGTTTATVRAAMDALDAHDAGAAVAAGIVASLEARTPAVRAAAAAAAAPCCDACASSRAGGHRTVPSLVASGANSRPPAERFADPQLQRLTPLTITDDGEVFGHLAPWGQCHTGSPMGECVLTPRSLSSYANFRTGYVVTAEGDEIPTGRLTLGGGHADLRLSHRGAVEHYDNAGSAIADLAAGEDAYGVWVHGSLRAGVTEEQLAAARASSPSGDWRQIGVGLELVAALCVNQPGFVVARVASGHIESLVAAGASVMAALSADPSEARIARLERDLAEMRAHVTAPARAQLSAMRRSRLRDQLAAMR